MQKIEIERKQQHYQTELIQNSQFEKKSQEIKQLILNFRLKNNGINRKLHDMEKWLQTTSHKAKYAYHKLVHVLCRTRHRISWTGFNNGWLITKNKKKKRSWPRIKYTSPKMQKWSNSTNKTKMMKSNSKTWKPKLYNKTKPLLFYNNRFLTLKNERNTIRFYSKNSAYNTCFTSGIKLV